MSIWEYTLLFVSVIIGGGAAFWYLNRGSAVLKLALSFSGAYLLGITVLHLMPSVFDLPSEQTGFWMLGGFLTQLLLEQFSKGIEHGHIHVHENHHQSFPIALLFGLSLHAFLEGLPLNHFEDFHLHHHGHEHGRFQLLIGIVLHKMPAAFALVSLLILSKYSIKTTIGCLLLFASMSPLGALLAGNLELSAQQVAYLMAFVIGSFLHISTTILFEADDTHQHRISWQKMGVILLGMSLALLADKV